MNITIHGFYISYNGKVHESIPFVKLSK